MPPVSTIDSARHSAIDVSSVHAPAGRPNGPPPTMSVTGSNVPGARNSTVVPTASPAARPSRAPIARSCAVWSSARPVEGKGPEVTYRLDPDRPLADEARRVAIECLDDAIRRLQETGLEGGDLEDDVHEARKRGKELRGLVRLVRPALGDTYTAVNAEVRDGARELSSLRDAHALLGTVEDLAAVLDGNGTDELDIVQGRLRVAATAATHGVEGQDPRIAVARGRMETARTMAETWSATIDADAMAGGVAKTADRGRTAWKSTRKDPTDDQVHEWRKRVKYLWYQARLLEPADPDGIGPLVEQLDDLSDLLGDEHDLTVLVEHLEASAGTAAMADVDVDRVVELARDRQSTLRAAALELGEQIYGDGVDAIVDRLVGPWAGAGGPSGGAVERERTFLVADMPELPDAGTRIRQGYLALDGDVQVRIRDRQGRGRSLTVKGGRGGSRTEVELDISADRFEQLWPLTVGRRIDKTRYVIPVDGADAELDVFAGDLTGLVLVEVELDSDEAMAAFEPPAWFGTEVTDDDRYSNASLAVRGMVRPSSG
jgi:CYTH domain-containing protein/CHAD domain-containing protein